MIASLPTLLQTKLSVPLGRDDRVPRPRLTQRLSASLERPLTLICAPAGFGKTTLITDWYQQTDRADVPLAWLSLDEDDNDPNRFLSYLAAAIGTIHAEAGDHLLGMLQMPQPPTVKSFLTALLNHVDNFPGRIALVLDDYHLITALPVHEAITYLLDHLTPRLRIIITSRADPPLPLGRLRARDQIEEFRAVDLRFTPGETGAFLETMLGITLPPDQITALETRTEGWIAGLQLACLALKGRKDVEAFIDSFTGSHRFILDYLVDEVLSRQSEAVQTFLMQTSVLDRLCAALCTAVTGQADSVARLDYLDHSNLFLIPLDEDRIWYRYHHLFADVLRRRLQHIAAGQEIELHHRASLWFEQQELTDEAIRHALKAGQPDRAAGIIELFIARMVSRGELMRLQSWIDLLPGEVVYRHVRLCVASGWIVGMARQSIPGTIEWAQAAQQALDKDATLSGDERREVSEYILALHSFGWRFGVPTPDIQINQQVINGVAESNKLARCILLANYGMHQRRAGQLEAAMRILRECSTIALEMNNFYMAVVAFGNITAVLITQGKLTEAWEVCQQGLRTMTDARGQNLPVVIFLYLKISNILYERNDLATCKQHIDKILNAFPFTIPEDLEVFALVVAAQIQQAEGDFSGANASLRDGVRIATEMNSILTGYASASQARLWLDTHQVEAASDWLLTANLTLDDDIRESNLIEHLVMARVLAAERRFEDAHDLLDRLQQTYESRQQDGHLIEIGMVQCLVLSAQGDTEGSLSVLKRILPIAEAGGYVRTFVDEGAPMNALLKQARQRDIQPAYVQKLLDNFNNAAPAAPSPARNQPRIGDDLEALSERELDVVRLMADGASNREIAEKLFVTVGTVKKHLNNIFTKLDVHSRTQALAVARQQNLL